MTEPVRKRQAQPAGPISANQLNFHQLYIFQTVASRLSNKDIEAVASYIQGLR